MGAAKCFLAVFLRCRLDVSSIVIVIGQNGVIYPTMYRRHSFQGTGSAPMSSMALEFCHVLMFCGRSGTRNVEAAEMVMVGRRDSRVIHLAGIFHGD